MKRNVLVWVEAAILQRLSRQCVVLYSGLCWVVLHRREEQLFLLHFSLHTVMVC